MPDRPKHPRPGSHMGDEARAMIGRTAPVRAKAIPDVVDDDVTGKYIGAELAKKRAGRPTQVRIGLLEQKHDELKETVGRIELIAVRTEAKTDGQTKLIEAIGESVDRYAARDDVEFKQSVIVHGAHAEDAIKAGAERRRFIYKAAGLALSGGFLWELVRNFLQRWGVL